MTVAGQLPSEATLAAADVEREPPRARYEGEKRLEVPRPEGPVGLGVPGEADPDLRRVVPCLSQRHSGRPLRRWMRTWLPTGSMSASSGSPSGGRTVRTGMSERSALAR